MVVNVIVVSWFPKVVEAARREEEEAAEKAKRDAREAQERQEEEERQLLRAVEEERVVSSVRVGSREVGEGRTLTLAYGIVCRLVRRRKQG